jgi:hypothetical protein
MNAPGRRRRLLQGALAVVAVASGALGSGAARAEGNIRYEVREEISGAIFPSHNYPVTGMCATGTGLAPASIFAQGGSGRGEGLGAGVGGRIFYQDAATPRPSPEGGSTWWGMRVGAGLDLDLLYGKVPTGISDMSGKLCARVKSDGADVQYAGSSVLLLQMPIIFGAQLGLGASDESANWHGIVLGAAWAPGLTYIKPWGTGGDLNASYLGTELTVDFATIHAGPSREPGKRAAVFLLLPVRDDGPVVLTFSFGAVWY